MLTGFFLKFYFEADEYDDDKLFKIVCVVTVTDYCEVCNCVQFEFC